MGGGSDMKCQGCNSEGAKKRRQNTSYVDDKENFSILCHDCQIEADEYWKDQWDEYYRGCM